MSLLSDFKEFAIKGHAVDMAVGIIVGGVFGKVVTSLVNDVIMPPIGKLVGAVDFSNLFINLSDTAYSTLAAAEQARPPVLKYGAFLETTIDFLIVALKEKNPPKPSEAVLFLRDIRDGLRGKGEE